MRSLWYLCVKLNFSLKECWSLKVGLWCGLFVVLVCWSSQKLKLPRKRNRCLCQMKGYARLHDRNDGWITSLILKTFPGFHITFGWFLIDQLMAVAESKVWLIWWVPLLNKSLIFDNWKVIWTNRINDE
jgi:hypothetical protein